jgi:hypothetical protein
MPLSCVPALVILNSMNPLQLAFVTSFTVENRSGESVRFTPIGTWGRDGNRSRLPIFTVGFPAFRSFKTGDFFLSHLDSKRVFYDWDDINFSEVAIRTEDGRYYQLVVDPNPTKGQYHPPETNRFVIPAVSKLDEIDPRVLEAVEKKGGGMSKFTLAMVCGLALPFVLWRLVVAYRKEKRNTQQSTQAPGAWADH